MGGAIHPPLESRGFLALFCKGNERLLRGRGAASRTAGVRICAWLCILAL